MANSDYIVIKGAKENNLKNIDINVPKERIVVIVGPSGSGKSSLVFNTIAAESARQLYDTFPYYIRNRIPGYPKPKVDVIEGVTAPVIINQKSVSRDIRSTVGTMTDLYPLLRLLFSRYGEPSAGYSSAYSFNAANGMCPECAGLGEVIKFDLSKVLDKQKSLNENPFRLPLFKKESYYWQIYVRSGYFDNDKPLKEYTEKEWNDLLYGKEKIISVKNLSGTTWSDSYNAKYEGLIPKINKIYLNQDEGKMNKTKKKVIEEFTVTSKCKACQGKRLNEAALASKIEGLNIWEVGELEINEALEYLHKLKIESAKEIIAKMVRALETLKKLGLDYLTMNRSSKTLSGGEAQKLKLVKHLNSGLSSMTYIFDEPTRGLHFEDIKKITEIIKELKKKGNNILIVDHTKSVMEAADYLIELGPGSGADGGKIVFEGNYEELKKANTATSLWLNQEKRLNKTPKQPTGYIELTDCNSNNLKNVAVKIPKGTLTVITGPAGSGKTSLACIELLRKCPKAVHISQEPIGTNERSTLATYVGVMDEIRRKIAEVNGVHPSIFSYNSKGGCPACKGKGVVSMEMAFMETVTSVCETCGGSRYKDEVLIYKLNGKNIVEIMQMTVSEAINFFNTTEKITKKLKVLESVGLGYLTLGRKTTMMSGGECQRLKLSARLEAREGIYVLDEPAAGLHGIDIDLLNHLLRKIVDKGNTVVVIEHSFDIISSADYVIDMGPQGGNKGGRIMFQGTAQEFAENNSMMKL